MRRARIVLAVVGLALVFCAPAALRAAQSGSAVGGIAILDYTRKPTFKVGDYVSYLVTGADQDGNVRDHYVLTVLIASQEIWWGERCFYIETIQDDGKAPPAGGATLMSYSIFDDSLPEEHVMMYARKMVMGYDPETGNLNEMLTSTGTPSASSRQQGSRTHTVKRDTVGTDTVQTAMGILKGIKVETHQAWGRSGGRGDSTTYEEVHEDRTQWVCDQVPLTGFALEVTKSSETRRSWLIGRSKDAGPAHQVSGGTVTARLIGYGHGLKSIALPADRVHSFDEAPAGRKRVAATRPGAATGGPRRR
jgi:hypothetical protein